MIVNVSGILYFIMIFFIVFPISAEITLAILSFGVLKGEMVEGDIAYSTADTTTLCMLCQA